MIVWLDYYAEQTPGVQVMDNATTVLGRKSEPQPDALLRILPEFGGQTRIEKKLLAGPPELVVEVSHATRYVDLGPKLEDYQRAGVLEYVVRALEPDEVFWFVREGGVLVERPLGEDGLYRSVDLPRTLARSPGAHPGRPAPPPRGRRPRLRHARTRGVRRQARGDPGSGAGQGSGLILAHVPSAHRFSGLILIFLYQQGEPWSWRPM